MARTGRPPNDGKTPKAATQLEFARIMDISQPAVHKLVNKGVLKTGHTIGQWLVAYGRHMSEVAAQWKSDDGIDRVKEAALLDRRKREQLEIDLAKERGELMACAEVAETISHAFAISKTKWLAFPSWLRSIMPHITPRESAQIEEKIREILTELSNERLPPNLRRLTEQYFSQLHAAAETNGDGVGGRTPDAELRE